ncbi:rhodanese-like domain-containing protein [Bombella sp. TMW 2.2543]|uniref:Rhodanese-like domain-containing protein n=1 Tax=Bombella pluederhausensis TaxID=2967336 RepID=A0ABT3WK17_9PROT|nr:rhodanese-like domain-containing protein [Bombella pluederhausensis]MCX5617186.1 rhodanese-like domain-containing protein [Bombella pluederhausensis]
MKHSTAKDAWGALRADSQSVLVDVRTPEEWAQVGMPELSSIGKKVVALTWGADSEAEFIHALEQAVPDKATPLFFICRSGMRSQKAAELAAQAGYETLTNVIDGFEDKHGPGTGWKACGLPVK